MSNPPTYNMGGLEYKVFAWDHRVYREIFLSGFVILFYDFFLTLGDEAKIMWASKMRPSTYWYLTLRYLPLGCSAAILVFYFGNLSSESCSRMENVLEALLIIQETLVEATLCLRVYAMYGFDPWVQASLLLTGGAASGLGIWTEIKYGKPQMLTAPGISGCHTAIPRATALRSAGAWIAQLSIDVIAFGLTVRRAYIERAVISTIPGSLIDRMVRDGAMYFGIIVLANLANVLTLFFGDIMIAGILSWWTTSLSVTLISRLMLNLHRAGVGNSQPATNAETDDTALEDIHFVGQQSRRGAESELMRSVDADVPV